MDLFKIVSHAVHQPLTAYLCFASHGKSVEAYGAADVGEDRFHRAQPFTVEISPNHGVYLALHFFGEGILAFFRSAQEIRNLPNSIGGFRITQALAPHFTGYTSRFWPTVFVGLEFTDCNIIAVGI